MTFPNLRPEDVETYFGFRSHWQSTRTNERVHYIDEGDPNGTAVIFVHGSAVGITGAANFYLNIPPLVRGGYRALAPDLYGYGWTQEAPEVKPGVPEWTDQILRFMDGLSLQAAYLVGNSLGGRITPRVALLAPNRILGNIVIGNGGALWKPEPRFVGGYMRGDQKQSFDKEGIRRSLEALVQNPAMIPDKLVEYRTRAAQLPGAIARFEETTRLRNASARVTLLDLDAAKRCPVPTLVMYGREDHLGPPENALACAEAFPNADLVVFGHCGHWTMLERADDFNELMLRFISGYDR